MDYIMNAISDIGQSRASNQDSLCVKKALWGDTPVVMAIICDGMGGLADGELASTTVVAEFNCWFETQLPETLSRSDGIAESSLMSQLQSTWRQILKDVSQRIRNYGTHKGERLGTTFTGLLIIGNRYIAVHIGDSRLYVIQDELKLLTTDHTVVNREILAGRMTQEEALRSPKRSILTQCVGASEELKPDLVSGIVSPKDVFLLCSDGFRHKLSVKEMEMEFNHLHLVSNEQIYEVCEELVNRVVLRGEKDNISAIVIKAE